LEIDGNRLRDLRDEKLLSTRELAQKAGLNHTTIVRLESQARVGVLPRTLRKLASALEIDPKSLRADR
jgi:transcriptional regulator with XRE-family HTH domain